ncbi:MAG TPA: hypothetical protein VFF06_06815 [Polyangia bacterium]|nr:hypothetical protein [Polyangia bacterium]
MRATAIVLLMTTMGCGAAASVDDAGAGADGGANDLTATVDQAHSDQPDGDTSSADDAGVITFYKLGIVNVSSQVSPSVNTGLSASFTDTNGTGACQRSEIGPCEITHCSATGAIEVDSGAVTFTGGSTPEVLTHMAGGYSSLAIPATIWAPGDTVQVSAAGAAVPAWSSSVVMPEIVMLTAPTLSGSPTWSRASDATFTWQGGTQTTAIFIASLTNGSALRCDFPATALSGTVPAAALSTLPPGQYLVQARAIDRKVVSVSDWLITVAAYREIAPGSAGGVLLQ